MHLTWGKIQETIFHRIIFHPERSWKMAKLLHHAILSPSPLACPDVMGSSNQCTRLTCARAVGLADLRWLQNVMMFDKYLVWVCTKWMLKSILVQNCTITMKVVIFDTSTYMYLVRICTKWISKSVLVQIHTMSMNIDIGMDCNLINIWYEFVPNEC